MPSSARSRIAAIALGAAVTAGVTASTGAVAAQPAAPATPAAAARSNAAGLDDPHKKEIAMELVSSAENSSLDWRAQYGYIKDIGDGRGYTGGIVGFTSGTGDMLRLVEHYNDIEPGNVLAKYLSALREANGGDSHNGLGPRYRADWKRAANDPKFRQAQNELRDSMYFNPAVRQAKQDGLRALGQFIYYDAMVMHGPGNGETSFGGIRQAALEHARPPATGGGERTYLDAFLDARESAMHAEDAHSDTSRIDTAQRPFVDRGNFGLNPPLHWRVYGERYAIPR